MAAALLPQSHAQGMTGVMGEGLSFDDGSPLELQTDLGHLLPMRWMTLPHVPSPRPALILVAGEVALLGGSFTVPPGRGWALTLVFAHGLPRISPDGLVVSVGFAAGDAKRHLLSFPLEAEAGAGRRELAMDLAPVEGWTGRVEIGIGPGPEGDPRGDWFALYDLTACARSETGLQRARGYASLRKRNELAHFAQAYAHPIYQGQRSAVDAPGPGMPGNPVQVPPGSSSRAGGPLPPGDLADGGPSHPAVEKSAYALAHEMLEARLARRPPDFFARIRALGQRKGAVKMLSLCSGEARIEAALIVACGVAVDITLVDLNDDLLARAVAGLPVNARARAIAGDVNSFEPPGGDFDVIICVSGLHHVVELERVLARTSGALAVDGEFWSVGEYIGCNGARLDRASYDVADAFFARLPERLRRNRSISGHPADAHLPNADCSDTSFEGIRAAEVEPLLMRFLAPIEIYRRNCFLWRLLDQSYADNYQASSAEDTGFIRQAVDLEHRHFIHGGAATELHGIFSRR